MSKRNPVPKKLSTAELIRRVRGSWNGVNPVTRVIPDKTKYRRRPKHPKRNPEW
jgi:hypothetical protein